MKGKSIVIFVVVILIFVECLKESLINVDKFYVCNTSSQKNKLKDFMHYTAEVYKAKIEEL